VSQFPFEMALHYLKEGGKVAREAWQGSVKYIFIDSNPEYITLRCRNSEDKEYSYSLYLDDLLAEDWIFVLTPNNEEQSCPEKDITTLLLPFSS